MTQSYGYQVCKHEYRSLEENPIHLDALFFHIVCSFSVNFLPTVQPTRNLPNEKD